MLFHSSFLFQPILRFLQDLFRTNFKKSDFNARWRLCHPLWGPSAQRHSGDMSRRSIRRGLLQEEDNSRFVPFDPRSPTLATRVACDTRLVKLSKLQTSLENSFIFNSHLRSRNPRSSLVTEVPALSRYKRDLQEFYLFSVLLRAGGFKPHSAMLALRQEGSST